MDIHGRYSREVVVGFVATTLRDVVALLFTFAFGRKFGLEFASNFAVTMDFAGDTGLEGMFSALCRGGL